MAGSRGRWLTVAVWLLLGAAGLLAHAHIDDVTAAGQSSFLPEDSESTRALDALQHASSGSEDTSNTIVTLGDRLFVKAYRRLQAGIDRKSVV